MLDGVISQNAAPKQPWLDRVNPELAPTGIALEPSVLFDPGSTVCVGWRGGLVVVVRW